MTQWIELSNVKQDGTPVSRNIKIPEMNKEIWFTTNAYAEVSDQVADLLAANIPAISKVAKPASPGTYYGDAGANTTVELVLSDGSFQNLTVSETTDTKTVESESAHVDHLPTSGYSPWGSPGVQAQKRLALPDFTADDDNPKITGSTVDWSSASVTDPTELTFPSHVDMKGLDNGLSRHGVYFAPHDTDGVGIAHFDDPTGAWTLRGDPVLGSGNGESGAFVREDTGEVWLYTNRPNDTVNLRTSPNGVDSWTDQGTVFSTNGGSSHAGYKRPLQLPNGSVALMGFYRQWDIQGVQTLHLSPDGQTDWAHYEQEWGSRARPTNQEARWFHMALLPWPQVGGYLAFWTEDLNEANTSNQQGDIRMGWTTNGLVIHDVGVVADGSSQAWMDGRVCQPSPFWHGDTLCLAICGGTPGGTSRQIGLLTADFSEVRV